MEELVALERVEEIFLEQATQIVVGHIERLLGELRLLAVGLVARVVGGHDFDAAEGMFNHKAVVLNRQRSQDFVTSFIAIALGVTSRQFNLNNGGGCLISPFNNNGFLGRSIKNST